MWRARVYTHNQIMAFVNILMICDAMRMYNHALPASVCIHSYTWCYAIPVFWARLHCVLSAGIQAAVGHGKQAPRCLLCS